MTISLGKRIETLRKTSFTEAPSKIERLAIIIPVKDNQNGIDRLLNSLVEQRVFPSFIKAIIIVDNNSHTPTHIPCDIVYPTEIEVLKCTIPGPAAARNHGAFYAIAKFKADWLLFVDSDCILSNDMFFNLNKKMDGSIGYQLTIIPDSEDWLSAFYHKCQTLMPRKILEENDLQERPEALITAGALVYAPAFQMIKGFCVKFPSAAGEDLMLGIKLRTIGKLAFLSDVLVRHSFTIMVDHVERTDLLSLIKRFYRYGQGNNLLEKLLKIELDVHMDRSPNVSLCLHELEFLSVFNFCLKEKKVISDLPLHYEFLLRIIHSAMYYGYHGVELKSHPCIKTHTNISTNENSFFVTHRHENHVLQHEYDKRYGLIALTETLPSMIRL